MLFLYFQNILAFLYLEYYCHHMEIDSILTITGKIGPQ